MMTHTCRNDDTDKGAAAYLLYLSPLIYSLPPCGGKQTGHLWPHAPSYTRRGLRTTYGVCRNIYTPRKDTVQPVPAYRTALLLLLLLCPRSEQGAALCSKSAHCCLQQSGVLHTTHSPLELALAPTRTTDDPHPSSQGRGSQPCASFCFRLGYRWRIRFSSDLGFHPPDIFPVHLTSR